MGVALEVPKVSNGIGNISLSVDRFRVLCFLGLFLGTIVDDRVVHTVVE